MNETKNPEPCENATVPTIVPVKEGFKIGPDTGAKGNTIPDKFTSSGAKIPSGYSKP